MKRLAVLVAACLASALAAGLCGAAVLIGSVAMTLPAGADWLGGLLVFAFIITLYGAIATVLLGLPAHLLLGRMGWTSLWAYILAGLIAGAGVALLLMSAGEPVIIAVSLVAGGSAATVFWWIARPDRRLSPRRTTPA